MTVPIPDLAAVFVLTFARIGTLTMLLPGMGERAIPSRVRLGFAFLLTVLLLPLTRGLLPTSRALDVVVVVLVGEIAVGLLLGLATRMIVAALSTAGFVASQSLGLGYAMTLDPTVGDQSAAVGNFLSLLGITLVFAADLHHLAIGAIRDSYAVLPPASLPDTGDALRLGIEAVGRGFSLGVRIAAPFIAFGILFNLGLGILSRLMPQMQVFFVGVPLSILIGMLILVATLAVTMGIYLDDLGRFLAEWGRA